MNHVSPQHPGDEGQTLLRERFTALTEPDSLDPDAVLGQAKARKSRRDVLRLGSGVAAVGALGALTWAAWDGLGGDGISPAQSPSGPPTQSASGISPSAYTPTPTGTGDDTPPTPLNTTPWPVTTPIRQKVLYLVDGNLAFSYTAASWTLWDVTAAESIIERTWAAESLASAAVNNCRTANTHTDNRNHWATLVPSGIGATTMTLIGSSTEIVVSGNSLPDDVPWVLLYWSAMPGEVESSGGFELKIEPSPGATPVTVRILP